jgi:6-phospho-beta-glucosidase
VKLAVVGGGSTYTPELVDGFARLRDRLPVSELVLLDPDTDRLAVVGAFAARIFAAQGHPGVVRTTDDVDDAVDGAAAVLLQLRVGGQAARLRDETLPLEQCCVGQETTGAGGLAKALRTVPVVLEIADRVAKRAPGAYLVDFTNPVGIVTRALLDAGHRAVGLCNVAIGFQRKFAALLGLAPERLSLHHVGLNHLTWERGVLVDGQDVLPRLLADFGPAVAADVRLPLPLLRRLGCVPSYYLRYFYEHDEVVTEQRSEPPRAAAVAAIERELLELYADPTVHEKPSLLEKRGGAFYSEAAVALVGSLLGKAEDDRPGADVQVVNVRNNGTLPFLADEAVVEVPAEISAGKAVPVRVPALPPLMAGLVAHVSAYEELALDAALRGGVDRVFEALLAHPLIGQAEIADRLADSLVAANRDFLPWATGGQ